MSKWGGIAPHLKVGSALGQPGLVVGAGGGLPTAERVGSSRASEGAPTAAAVVPKLGDSGRACAKPQHR